MTGRGALYLLLAVVATAAAVLSFDALRGLALLCGFSRSLAWLLPVVVDAGAAAGSLVWLGGRADIRARRFARALALVLLGSSVAANALSHGLAAYNARPAWWVVVMVSGVAPAVLGAVVHLAVLVGRGDPAPAVLPVGVPLGVPTAPALDQQEVDCVAAGVPADVAAGVPAALHSVPSPAPPGDEAGDRAAELIAAGAGRRKLSRELGISEHDARALLTRHREVSTG